MRHHLAKIQTKKKKLKNMWQMKKSGVPEVFLISDEGVIIGPTPNAGRLE